jgi:hypothetical protein
MTFIRTLFLFLLPGLLFPQGLDSVRKEPNLTRRAQRALEHSEREMARAQKIVRDFGSKTELEGALAQVAEGAELALQSLRETGRPPRRLSRDYKRGELKTRDLLRKLEDLEKALSLDDRPLVEAIRVKVSRVHEDFLAGVMGQSTKR